MTESAEDRTKRTFVSHLLRHEWTHQVTIFYESYSDALNAVEHGGLIRRAIPRRFPDQAFLWRLALKYMNSSMMGGPSDVKSVAMPYHTFFTNLPVDEERFQEAVERQVGVALKVRCKAVDAHRISKYARAVKTQRPHDLKRVFGDRRIHRQSLLNRKKATPVLI